MKLSPLSGPVPLLLFLHLSHLCPHPVIGVGSRAAKLVSGTLVATQGFESRLKGETAGSQNSRTFSALMTEWHLVAKEAHLVASDLGSFLWTRVLETALGLLWSWHAGTFAWGPSWCSFLGQDGQRAALPPGR